MSVPVALNTCEFESLFEKSSNEYKSSEKTFTYDELLNLYENEKKLRVEIEKKFEQKTFETSKHVI